MGRTLSFVKLSGAGNDFVLLDAPVSRPSALARRLCDRRRGIGADGLLVLGRGLRPSLAYYNADGSGAFCGNGTRCAAWWLKRGKPSPATFTLETSAGALQARVTARGSASIAMPAPTRVRLGLRLPVADRTLTAHALDTGTAHAVVFVDDLDDCPVLELGPALRHHAEFSPGGVNANFARARGGSLSLRTYERGVEAETLACGTGAVAAAVAAALLGLARPPVAVKALGGELRVSFKRAGEKFSDVWLEGPARLVFTGEITL